MKNATKTQIYFCKTLTEAKDKANLIYISNPLANRLNHDKQDKTITITRERNGNTTYFAIISY